MSPTATTTAISLDQVTPAPSRGDLAGTAAEGLLVIVAPANGRFQPVVSEGRLGAGAVVARITSGRGRALDVRVPAAAAVRGLLTLPGQLVTRGQALAWAQLEPAGSPA